MIRIGIILGSTRPDRNGEQVARWVHERASQRGDVDVELELVDLRDHPLPHLEDPPGLGVPDYPTERHRRWGEVVASLDGFVIVTPEYNHGIPGVLKNALDHLQREWHDKAVGFVSYGAVGGARSVEQLRTICGALQMADVTHQVTLPLPTEFENHTTFRPSASSAAMLEAMLDKVVAWTTALAALRTPAPASAAAPAPAPAPA